MWGSLGELEVGGGEYKFLKNLCLAYIEAQGVSHIIKWKEHVW